MQCMEVWGGNQCVDSRCAVAGLDAWVYSQAHAGAAGGGDVYFVSSCATGRITRLLVADVSGHGSAVHDAAVGLRGLMRRYVNYIDQTRFVRAMNRQFAAMSAAGHFATALVTTFFAPTSRLSVCNAGHPPPLFYRPAEGRWRFLEHGRPPAGTAGLSDALPDVVGDSTRIGDEDENPSNLPLGIIEVADYDQFDVDLRPGDLVLCYTDALPEARDAAGRMLGQAGLLAVANDAAPGDPATLVARLLARVAAMHPDNLRTDDVTALLFRPTGAPAAPTLRTWLLAPVRIARAVAAAGGLGRPGEAPWPELSAANLGGGVIGSLGRGRSRRKVFSDASPAPPLPRTRGRGPG